MGGGEIWGFGATNENFPDFSGGVPVLDRPLRPWVWVAPSVPLPKMYKNFSLSLLGPVEDLQICLQHMVEHSHQGTRH